MLSATRKPSRKTAAIASQVTGNGRAQPERRRRGTRSTASAPSR